jgi:HSP20 family protein
MMKMGIARLNNSDFTLSSVFDDFFRMVPTSIFSQELIPKIDVSEDEKAVYVKAEIPGLNEKDLEVTLEEKMLTISGEKKEETTEENKDKNYRHCERKFGSFSRSIEMPDGIKADSVKASYKNGVLDIELPKSEIAQPKKINISVN